MKNLIPACRTDRIREMNEYEKKGYSIQNKDKYIMLDFVETEYCGQLYRYGIQVTRDDLYFFITRNSANVYLTIVELYELMRSITQKESDFLITTMKRQLRIRRESKVRYRGLEYKIPEIALLPEKGEVVIPDSGMKISYDELYVLMNLIQAKSSALFKRGKAKDKKYAMGLLRLFIVLLSKQESITLLEELGWEWDDVEKKHQFCWKKKKEGRGKYKYYLTRREYETIMD